MTQEGITSTNSATDGEPTGTRMPAYFLAHGAGPCFFMEWTQGPRDTWTRLGAWLQSMESDAGRRPRAIVVISAHWEAHPLRVNGQHRSGLLYDYGGFPAHTYELQYPAPGSQELARRVQALLVAQGLSCDADDERGLDHGVFIPLMLAYPAADIPVVQLSLHPSLDPETHQAMGRALAPLREEGVLLLGSGMSYHNRVSTEPGAEQMALGFDQWLQDAVCQHTGDARARQLNAWLDAPGARRAHPREEHLLPLMVIAGASEGDAARASFCEPIGNIPVSCFRFGV